MYFVACSEKEKEDWINSIGRSIVQSSRSVTDSDVIDYDSKRTPSKHPQTKALAVELIQLLSRVGQFGRLKQYIEFSPNLKLSIKVPKNVNLSVNQVNST